VRNALRLTSWQEADDALRQIGEHRRDLSAIENVLNEQIAAAKANADAKARPLKESITMLEAALREYAQEHRADMGKAKSKVMTFGKVGFRLSSRVKLPTGAAKVTAIIDKLLARGMQECVVYPAPKIDKEALRKYAPSEIAEVGASLEVEDVFGYEIDETALAEQ